MKGNPKIWKQAAKGGKARWKGSTKKERREFAIKGAYTRWARVAVEKERKEETPA